MLSHDNFLDGFNNRQIIYPGEMAKSHNLYFYSSIHFVSKPLELIYYNVWRPTSIVYSYGSCYDICFLDVFLD